VSLRTRRGGGRKDSYAIVSTPTRLAAHAARHPPHKGEGKEISPSPRLTDKNVHAARESALTGAMFEASSLATLLTRGETS